LVPAGNILTNLYKLVFALAHLNAEFLFACLNDRHLFQWNGHGQRQILNFTEFGLQTTIISWPQYVGIWLLNV